MTTTLVALVMGGAALAVFVRQLAHFEARHPAYSRIGKTISELGEVGTPIAVAVAWRAFVPIGLAYAVALAALAGALPTGFDRAGLMLMSGFALAYVGSAFLPTDRDAPLAGSTRNTLHILLALVTYLMELAGLAALVRAFEEAGLMLASGLTNAVFAILIASIAGLSLSTQIPSFRRFRGAAQRPGEYAVAAWPLAVSLSLLP